MSTGAYVGIPKTYTPVEYIESSGTQYIDTGIYPNSSIHCYVDFQMSSIPTSSEIVAGAWEGSKGMLFGVHVANGLTNFEFAFGTGAWGGNTQTADTNRHTVYMNDENGDGRLDNTVLASHTNVVSLTNTDYKIYLFRCNGGVTYYSKCKIYSCKIYNGSVLIRDYVPALDGNNVPCLYDKVENKFYYNQGTGAFSYGTASTPVTIGSYAREVKKIYVGIPASYTPVEYIESSGTQYIDTGIPASATIKTLCDMSTSTGGYPFGVTPSQNTKYYGANVSITNQRIQSYFGTTNNYTIANNVWTLGERFILTANDNYKFYKDSTQIADYATGTTKEFDSSLPITIFALNGLYLSSRITMKLYGFKMYDNSTLIRDFIPALDSNNVPCLYESVEGKFYYNKGTGTFTYGTAGTPVAFGSFARKVKKAYVGVSVSYTPVEYIESSGPQYVDTGVLMKDTLKVEGEFYDVNNYGYWYGARKNINGVYPGITGTSTDSDTNHRFTYGGITGNNFIKITPQVNTWHTVSHSRTLYLDNSLVTTFDNSSFSIENSLCIFALNDPPNLYTGTNSVRMKWFKVYDGNLLVRDFIPVLNQDNVACLYEQVEGKFYYNAGTGTFTAGSTTGEQVVIGSVARLCYKGTTIWEAFIELCRANPTKSAASRVLQYQTQIESLMAQNGKDVNSYHSIYAHTDGSGFEVIFVVPTTYWYKYNETVSGNVYAFYISGRSGSQSVDWLSASDIRYYANTSWVEYSNDVIGVFSKASSGGSPSANCVVEVMSE